LERTACRRRRRDYISASDRLACDSRRTCAGPRGAGWRGLWQDPPGAAPSHQSPGPAARAAIDDCHEIIIGGGGDRSPAPRTTDRSFARPSHRSRNQINCITNAWPAARLAAAAANTTRLVRAAVNRAHLMMADHGHDCVNPPRGGYRAGNRS